MPAQKRGPLGVLAIGAMALVEQGDSLQVRNAAVVKNCARYFCGLILTLTLALIDFNATGRATASDAIQGRASIVDGDTIEIHGQRIRLWGIDAPESRQPCYLEDGSEWRCGREAAFALADWLGARPLFCEVVDVDRYQRLVAVCEVGSEQVNAWMVRQGWALDYAKYSKGEYADEQRLAVAEKLGVWRGTLEPPWEWRRK